MLPGVTPAAPEISGNKIPGPVLLESHSKVRMATAPPNILVVEDDRETRSLIAKYLRGNGCNVTAASDGREMARATIASTC
jgi:PleD family two-component response regulator